MLPKSSENAGGVLVLASKKTRCGLFSSRLQSSETAAESISAVYASSLLRQSSAAVPPLAGTQPAAGPQVRNDSSAALNGELRVTATGHRSISKGTGFAFAAVLM